MSMEALATFSNPHKCFWVSWRDSIEAFCCQGLHHKVSVSSQRPENVTVQFVSKWQSSVASWPGAAYSKSVYTLPELEHTNMAPNEETTLDILHKNMALMWWFQDFFQTHGYKQYGGILRRVFFFTFQYLTGIGLHWVEFFPSAKLQNGCAD